MNLEVVVRQGPSEHRSNLLPTRAGMAGMAGILAVLLGGWMLVGPSDGRLTIFLPGLLDQTWNATDLVATWAAPLLILGGLLAAGTFGWIAWTSRSTRRVAGATICVALVAIGLVAALIGVSRLT